MDMTELMKKHGGAKGKPMDPQVKDAKMGILKEISDMASQSMGNDVKGLKKVSVMSNDKAGLAEGLDKARDLVDGNNDAEDQAEAHENPDVLHEHPRATRFIDPKVEDEMTPQDLDDLIAELQARKAELTGKSE